jgi:hypothetical protein
MDRPEIKVKLNRQQSNVAYEPPGHSPDAAHEPSSWRQRTHRSRGDKPSFFAQWQESATKSKIFLPIGLATLTGVLLGICLLVLFKGQSEGPTVTTIPAPAGAHAAVAAAAAELPEASLYAWQVGVFQERPKAEEVQKEIEAKGIPVSLRGTGPYQLFAGVAPDKKANSLLEAELNKQKVVYYVKEFKVPAAKCGIAGVKDADAKLIESTLRKEAKLADDLLNAVLTAQDKARMEALHGQTSTLGAEIKSVQTLLSKAGLKDQAALVDTMHGALVDAGTSALSKPVAAEGKLALFYVRFEELSGKLIQVR